MDRRSRWTWRATGVAAAILVAATAAITAGDFVLSGVMEFPVAGVMDTGFAGLLDGVLEFPVAGVMEYPVAGEPGTPAA